MDVAFHDDVSSDGDARGDEEEEEDHVVIRCLDARFDNKKSRKFLALNSSRKSPKPRDRGTGE